MTALSLQIATRYHDWSGGGALEQIVEALAAAGLFGDVAWSRVDFRTKERKHDLPRGADQAAAVVALLPPINHSRALDVGGDQPARWSSQLLVAPMRPDRREVRGTNAASLEIADAADPAAVIDVLGQLLERPGAEYGWIHEPASEGRLRKDFAQDPTFTTLIFPCAFWCNHLGPRVADKFDRGRLVGLDADEVIWRDDGALWVKATATLDEALTAAGEQRLRRLTRQFRGARLQP